MGGGGGGHLERLHRDCIDVIIEMRREPDGYGIYDVLCQYTWYRGVYVLSSRTLSMLMFFIDSMYMVT